MPAGQCEYCGGSTGDVLQTFPQQDVEFASSWRQFVTQGDEQVETNGKRPNSRGETSHPHHR